MTLDQKIDYNKGQAEKYEWKPEWFGASDFNGELVSKIKEFQKEHGLSPDGLCGPSTYRRLFTERESEIDTDYINQHSNAKKYIVHNSTPVEIHWDKVILWNDDNGLSCRKGSYTDRSGKLERHPDIFVTHWDVCLSSRSCAKVLSKRGLSVHFCIDNDGTIFQLLDTQHIAFHAGSFNRKTIGVEVSTAYSLKYQNWYKKKGFGERPIWDNAKVHGSTLKPFLGFYDVQIDALAALYEAISRACGIPLKSPPEKNHTSREISAGEFSGFCSHYHLTRRKIDCAGLDLDMVIEKANGL